MYPTLVLVGRPNVGKSTLFNRLTRSRDAIVADVPGLTRDRHYGEGQVGGLRFLAVDTGGFEPQADSGIAYEMAKQTVQAIGEGDVVLFIADARDGLMAQDTVIAQQLRRCQRPVLLVVNKAEGLNSALVKAEFYELGLGEPYTISASHGDGVAALAELALQDLPAHDEPREEDKHPRIAIVGRPNVGKSTLFNRLLGEERSIVMDAPGTTRDSIDVTFERNGKRYTLVDTAGIRRRGVVTDMVEKFSIIKTMQSVTDSNVVLLLLDATQPVAEQDARIAGFVVEAGKALVVAVNKWDGLRDKEREQVKRELDRQLGFLSFARTHYVSALTGLSVETLLSSIDAAYRAAMLKMPTPKLTRALIDAVTRQQPPRRGPKRPKLRYAHQGGSNPPIIIVHGNALDEVSDSYRRYLENAFRKHFALEGTPLRVHFRQGRNPFHRAD